ncbi:MAG: DUF3465 domain-containing protein [Pseudomonadota bacterium]
MLALVVWLERSEQGQLSQGASNSEVAEAYAGGLSDVWVEGEGRVLRLLSDDNEGSRHQRFVLEVGPDHTVLVAHNIDLAPRIDALRSGDEVRFVGEYVWNDQGGIIHWTHHDPDGRHSGGWIEHEGRRYE